MWSIEDIVVMNGSAGVVKKKQWWQSFAGVNKHKKTVFKDRCAGRRRAR